MIGIIITCYDYVTMQSEIAAGAAADFSFSRHLLLNMAAGFMGAVMGGIFLVFYVNEKYRDKPYGLTVVAVAVSFVVVVSIITVLLGLIFIPLNTGKPITDPETKKRFIEFLTSPLHIKNIIVWLPVVILTQMMLQFNTRFGEGSMWKLISGRYQTPFEEHRIFMFVDLNGSTAIAEKLGDEKYHHLLKDFFADITNPVLDSKGEIYQYAGDEVVVTWKYEEGIFNNRCLACFFNMKKQIAVKTDYYKNNYSLVPGFKAGLHSGKVIAGEIGIIKRDITFSGDVLNTTSRIQGKCKEFDAEIIVSESLLNSMHPVAGYLQNHLGSISLRGKGNDIKLSSVSPVDA
jgi:adenylate cyclase